MIKNIILFSYLSLLLGNFSICQVSLPFEEHFIYETGGLTSVGPDWIRAYFGSSSSTTDIQVISGGMIYPNYPMSLEGNQIEMSSNLFTGSEGIVDYLSFSPISVNDKLYVSFLINIATLADLPSQPGANYFAGISGGDPGLFAGHAQIWIRKTLNEEVFNLGISKKNSDDFITWAPQALPIRTNLLLVLGYEVLSGINDDVLKLWINPSLDGLEPTPDASTSITAEDGASIEYFYLRQTSEELNALIDAIRIAQNWSYSPLPVELHNFSLRVLGSSVILNWATKTEVNNFGFEVERKVGEEWQKISFVNGYGNSNSQKEYSYIDKNPLGGKKLRYRLKQIDNDGVFKYSNEIEASIDLSKFELFQNYPNPFNPITKIRYQIPYKSRVAIRIYNILGVELLSSTVEEREPGIYEFNFNAESFPSGTYLYIIEACGTVDTKKMILIK